MFMSNPGRDKASFRYFMRFQQPIGVMQDVREYVGEVRVSQFNYGLFTLATDDSNFYIGLLQSWFRVARTNPWHARQNPWRNYQDMEAILAIFIAIYMLFHLMPEFASRHFVASRASLRDGRFWSLFLSVLSHRDFWHLCSTVLFWYGTAPLVHYRLGRAKFLKLFFLGGITATSTSLLAWPHLTGRKSQCIGATGALCALVGYLAAQEASGSTSESLFYSIQFAVAQLCLAAIYNWQIDWVAQSAGLFFGWFIAANKIL